MSRAKSRVLVVDDERAIRRALAINLKTRGYDADLAANGYEALTLAATRHQDAVILDIGLPDINGIDVVRSLRKWSSVPIVILSARETERDKVAALDAGADDYVTKPFGMEEFLARLRAAVRRGSVVADSPEVPVVDAGAFVVDLGAKSVTRDGAAVHLTPTEWGILEILVRHEGKLVGQKEILQSVWGPSYGTQTNYLRVYLASLRRKLEDDPAHPKHLLTEAGMGYRFVRS